MRPKIPEIVATLARHRHRATYAAVGGVAGLPARSAMQGQAKTPMNSWVVAKKTGMPTGYTTAECDPRLTETANVISSPEQLRSWLDQHR